jgi:hypothetical protein
LVEPIGQGANGTVYRGRVWGTDVAVKLLISAHVPQEVLNSLQVMPLHF